MPPATKQRPVSQESQSHCQDEGILKAGGRVACLQGSPERPRRSESQTGSRIPFLNHVNYL